MSEYTPGPWTVNSNGDLVGGNGKRVVMYGLRASFCMSDPSKEQRANARIAESSAELLEVLKACLTRMKDDGYHSDEVEWAEDAIAKAEGK